MKDIPRRGIIQSKGSVCSRPGMFEDLKNLSDQSRKRKERGKILDSMVRVDFQAYGPPFQAVSFLWHSRHKNEEVGQSLWSPCYEPGSVLKASRDVLFNSMNKP